MKTKINESVANIIAAALGLFLLAGCAGNRSTAQYVDDTALTANINSRLLADPTVSGTAVNVESFRGVVQLNGFVPTQAQKQRAAEIARGVDGVRSVQNNLQVTR